MSVWGERVPGFRVSYGFALAQFCWGARLLIVLVWVSGFDIV